MRILFLTPSVRPLGARRSLVELIRALPEGVEPFVICPGDVGIGGELRQMGVATAIAPQGAWRKPVGRAIALFRQIPQIKRVVRQFRPDVIHANEFHSVPQGACAAGSTPLCGHIRLSITPRQVRNYRLADCRRIVAVSQDVASLLDGSGLEDRARVVYNGVDVAQMTAPGAPSPEVEAWLAGFARRPTVFGLLGLVSARKNQLAAVEGLAAALAQGADAALLLAGDAFKSSEDYGAELQQRISRDDVRGRVLWLPFQSNAAALYRSIDANLLISSEEGFGRTIIEAGALGKPSIGSSTGGIPEIIQDGVSGGVIHSTGAEQVAAAMVKYCQSEALRTEHGAAMKARVDAHFTIQAHARNMISVWKEASGQ